ncbi:hypothetical protein TNCV_291971 [Trichonephila clavipes]|nr:hypothetical protein TNCV_291971 [Trichonephila clavipes]
MLNHSLHIRHLQTAMPTPKIECRLYETRVASLRDSSSVSSRLEKRHFVTRIESLRDCSQNNSETVVSITPRL